MKLTVTKARATITITMTSVDRRLVNILVSFLAWVLLDCQFMTLVYVGRVPQRVCEHGLSVFFGVFSEIAFRLNFPEMRHQPFYCLVSSSANSSACSIVIMAPLFQAFSNAT